MKRLIAIGISFIVIAYFFTVFILPFFTVDVFTGGDSSGQAILCLLPMVGVVFIVMMVRVLKERLSEIDRGEDDDISKY